jgi:hypothetical protein
MWVDCYEEDGVMWVSERCVSIVLPPGMLMVSEWNVPGRSLLGPSGDGWTHCRVCSCMPVCENESFPS